MHAQLFVACADAVHNSSDTVNSAHSRVQNPLYTVC